MVLTVERYLEALSGLMPNTYANDRVVIIPYVSSTFLDADPGTREAAPIRARNASKWWFFRGNMQRYGITGHARLSLRALAEHLGQGRCDFVSAFVPKRATGRHTRRSLLVETADEMRDAALCLCPAGDSPTSLRLFESLAAGCVPVVSSDKMHMTHVLPFPNLIDWDEVAFFTEALNDVTSCGAGVFEMADTLNRTMGREAGEEQVARLERMSRRGVEVFQKHFSYFRNPRGVADGALYEAYTLMKEKGIYA
mmetsp:Transcript_49811/g.124311  ORF Transcript_49811/g.124311 Transcript_49811/m.124311 type:complete len:253 (+) Transcript_49811:210-968(+)